MLTNRRRPQTSETKSQRCKREAADSQRETAGGSTVVREEGLLRLYLTFPQVFLYCSLRQELS